MILPWSIYKRALLSPITLQRTVSLAWVWTLIRGNTAATIAATFLPESLHSRQSHPRAHMSATVLSLSGRRLVIK